MTDVRLFLFPDFTIIYNYTFLQFHIHQLTDKIFAMIWTIVFHMEHRNLYLYYITFLNKPKTTKWLPKLQRGTTK